MTKMLSDDQKKIIEAEERHRHAVRKTLEEASAALSNTVVSAVSEVKKEKAKFNSQLMIFLNSSVGTLLLSSVVITGGAGLIQQIQHNHETHQKNREQLVLYKFEIENRLDNMEFALRRAQTVGEAKDALDKLFKSKFPLSPELQNRSLASLYLNIYELVPGTQQQKAQAALGFIRELENAESLLTTQTDNTKSIDEKDKVQFTKLIQSIKVLKLSAP
jgi:hypothetical protein